jgi:hypothetical protein
MRAEGKGGGTCTIVSAFEIAADRAERSKKFFWILIRGVLTHKKGDAVVRDTDER